VTGGELKKRIEGIMENRFAREIGFGKRALLASAALLAIAGPIAIGLMNIPRGSAQLQTGQAVEFEVVSVKVIKLSDRSILSGRRGGPGTSDPGVYHWAGARMTSLLEDAYGVESDEVLGPGWITDPLGPNLYLIDAKIPPGTTREQFRLMMQNLLKERFHLAVHHEIRNFPGYDLVALAGGTKLKPRGTLPKDSPTLISRGFVRHEGRGESMVQLARTLRRMIAESLGTADAQPRVQDKTGLTGTFDFTLEYSCLAGCGPPVPPIGLPRFAQRSEPADAAADPSGAQLPNIFRALEEQLGLKLQKVKDVPVDVIVVDRVDKVPVAN
jgi:uncharacterized protein (TIGR03435 family)